MILVSTTIMGGHPWIAGRFYGFGNPLFAVFGAAIVAFFGARRLATGRALHPLLAGLYAAAAATTPPRNAATQIASQRTRRRGMKRYRNAKIATLRLNGTISAPIRNQDVDL